MHDIQKYFLESNMPNEVYNATIHKWLPNKPITNGLNIKLFWIRYTFSSSNTSKFWWMVMRDKYEL